jgi:hypothetical protein
MSNITLEELLQIVGSQHVQILMLQKQVAALTPKSEPNLVAPVPPSQ